MKNDNPEGNRPTNMHSLASARGEQFFLGCGIDRADDRRLRFWDERDARDWLCQFTENGGSLRPIAVTITQSGDLAGYSDDNLLDVLACNLVNGTIGAMRAQAVRTRALQPRVEMPEETSAPAPSKPSDSWIRIDCETVLEKPLGVKVGDDAGSGIRVSTKLKTAA